MTPGDPHEVLSVILEVFPRSKVMTLQEKVELLDIYHRLRSVAVVICHFKINEPSVRTTVKKKKEIHEATTAAMPAGAIALHLF